MQQTNMKMKLLYILYKGFHLAVNFLLVKHTNKIVFLEFRVSYYASMNWNQWLPERKEIAFVNPVIPIVFDDR